MNNRLSAAEETDLTSGPNHDSIKPSMLVDVENNREIELDEICNVVIKNCEAQGLDAPYTRTISTLLEYTYYKK